MTQINRGDTRTRDTEVRSPAPPRSAPFPGPGIMTPFMIIWTKQPCYKLYLGSFHYSNPLYSQLSIKPILDCRTKRLL